MTLALPSFQPTTIFQFVVTLCDARNTTCVFDASMDESRPVKAIESVPKANPPHVVEAPHWHAAIAKVHELPT